MVDTIFTLFRRLDILGLFVVILGRLPNRRVMQRAISLGNLEGLF
jgi:hypothetical protein